MSNFISPVAAESLNAKPSSNSLKPTASQNAAAEPAVWTVAALYQFKVVEDPTALQQTLLTLVNELKLCGTLIVAGEGINGTVAGTQAAITTLHDTLVQLGFDRMEYKESTSENKPFKRTKVKLKPEIVTLGVDVQPRELVGHYLQPEEWNELIAQDDVVLIDTRNKYEYKAGTFKNAINPNTQTFREFPDYVKGQLADAKDKKVAMFCTGGIRCEKSTSLLLQEGFEEVYHLKGGILNYLEKTQPEKSLWEGECFVFDGRVGVTHGVAEGETEMCFGCGWPVFADERDSEKYERGVSCNHCYDKTTEKQKYRYRMRQQQLDQQKKAEKKPY